MRIVISLLMVGFLAACAAAEPVTRIPFEFAGHHTFIEVELRGQKLSFVFDTGAGGVALNARVADRLQIEASGSGPATGAGGTVRLPIVRGLTLEVGRLRLRHVTAALVPLEHLEQRLGRPLDGIIGEELLAGRVLLLDHDRRVIELHPHDAFDFVGWGEPCELIGRRPLEVAGGLRLIAGDRLPGNFYVDSGAALFVSLNAPFVEEHGLADRVGETYSRRGSALTGIPMKDRIGRVEAVEFCGHVFPTIAEESLGPVPTVLSGAEAGVQSRRGPIGLLGNAVLRRFNLVLDADGRRMYVRPNAHLNDPIRTNVTGMVLLRRPDGTIVIDQVFERSPAAERGLAAGDEIRAVDDVAVATTTLSALRERLMEPDREFTLLVIRDAHPRTLKIKSRRF